MFDTCFSRLWGALTVLFIALVAHQSVSAQEARPKTTLTIAHPIALKGNAIAPYDPMPNMTTVFCSVIVDNQTGNPLTMTQVQPGNIDNSTVFDTLMLVTCDNQGKTLDRALYMWNPFSFPRQIALPQGKTTNTL